jgi:hypothetical protein
MWTKTSGNLRFSKQYNWGFRSSGMSCCVNGCVIPNVFKAPFSFWDIGNHSPNDMEAHLKTPESSTGSFHVMRCEWWKYMHKEESSALYNVEDIWWNFFPSWIIRSTYNYKIWGKIFYINNTTYSVWHNLYLFFFYPIHYTFQPSWSSSGVHFIQKLKSFMLFHCTRLCLCLTLFHCTSRSLQLINW